MALGCVELMACTKRTPHTHSATTSVTKIQREQQLALNELEAKSWTMRAELDLEGGLRHAGVEHHRGNHGGHRDDDQENELEAKSWTKR